MSLSYYYEYASFIFVINGKRGSSTVIFSIFAKVAKTHDNSTFFINFIVGLSEHERDQTQLLVMNLTLRPYQPTDANVITTWLKSEYLMRQWCADRYERFPVTPENMNSYHQQYIDGHNSVALTMVDSEEIVGYITLRTPADDSSEQRLGFVIVDDSQRGKGFGKALVSMAVDYAFSKLGALKVSLGVFENNPAAIRCYESVGFHRVVRYETESYDCLGQIWDCIEMELLDNAIKSISPL
ncbi:MAG: GNAT family protein [Bacteroidales bacterium]|nr:GNAT family protein [Bacteroidales bacterium]